ncbi:MAG: hypothetical protein ACYTF1_21230, partial [Planctomycetota bacterium]
MPHPKRANLLLILSALAGLALAGCQDPASTGRARPSALTGQYPGYVYPDKAPLVNRSTLTGLLKQFATDRIILWVMDDINHQTPEVASVLSAQRAALRSAGVRVVGLYSGPPREWQSQLKPTLRRAKANFTCAVIEPSAIESIANWLTNNPLELEPSLYVLDKYQHVITQLPPTPYQAKSLVADLTDSGIGSITIQPASRPIMQARIRLIELKSGNTLATVTSGAPNPDLVAKDIAQQLSTQIKPTGTVAVLPIRRLGNSLKNEKSLSQSLGPYLYSYLTEYG